MTAIAGFTDGNTIWIGGDSAGVAGYQLTIRADSKVFRSGEFLFGFTTSFRMGQLIRYRFKPPTIHENQDLFEYMATDFVDTLRDCLKAGGFAAKNSEREEGGTFMIGLRGRLFIVDGDYQVEESRDEYSAVGCAGDIVRGSMFSTKGIVSDPKERIRIALLAAEHHSGGVRSPFIIESVTKS